MGVAWLPSEGTHYKELNNFTGTKMPVFFAGPALK
jgi:hypothetical protein